MARTRNEPDTVQFTITLPRVAAEHLEKLAATGLYGTSRAAVAAEIIRDHLKKLWEINKLPG